MKDYCPICADAPLEDSGTITNVEWLQCEPCGQWFHTRCLHIPSVEIKAIKDYHCANCEPTQGPSTHKRRSKRAKIMVDYVALNDGNTFIVDKSEHPHVSRFEAITSDIVRGKEDRKDDRKDDGIEMRDNIKIETEHGINGAPESSEKSGSILSHVKREGVNGKESDIQKGSNGSNGSIESNGSEINGSELNGSHTDSPSLSVCSSISRLHNPTLIPRCDPGSLGMAFPRPIEQIDLDYITECTGEDEPVEVMDVLSQQGVQPSWKMGQWRDYFKSDDRDRIRNVISLEISDTSMGKGFRRPQLVRDLDLVDKVWPEIETRPKVTKYCLMSVRGSFTDFHIDFGGTSVYYTVCTGKKTFLMYPPTTHNLEVYEKWCLEQDQNYIWLPDYGKGLRGAVAATLEAGDLFFIPSGWIHAVYTPEDSIVIGGNFLTFQDMEMQLRVAGIEKRTRVPSRFRFPMFNKVVWLSAWEMVKSKQKPPQGLWKYLSAHFELSKSNTTARRSVPGGIGNVGEFLESLRKAECELL